MKTHNQSLKILGASVCLYGAAIAYPVSGHAAVECALNKDLLAQHARFQRMEGGIPKGEVEAVLPAGSILTLIVDRETREWKILTVRPDSITCIVFEGMEWMAP